MPRGENDGRENSIIISLSSDEQQRGKKLRTTLTTTTTKLLWKRNERNRKLLRIRVAVRIVVVVVVVAILDDLISVFVVQKISARSNFLPSNDTTPINHRTRLNEYSVMFEPVLTAFAPVLIPVTKHVLPALRHASLMIYLMPVSRSVREVHLQVHSKPLILYPS